MRRIVVLRRLELGELALDAEARGHGERADVVVDARVLGRDEVGEAVVRLAVRALVLLAQVVPGQRGVGARLVASRARCRRRARCAGQKPTTPFAVSQRPSMTLLQHRLAFGEHGARRLADDGVVEDRRDTARQAPTPGRTGPSRCSCAISAQVDVAKLAAADATSARAARTPTSPARMRSRARPRARSASGPSCRRAGSRIFS